MANVNDLFFGTGVRDALVGNDWDASTGSFPPQSETSEGFIFLATVAGQVGADYYSVGDSIIFHKGVWQRLGTGGSGDALWTQISTDTNAVGTVNYLVDTSTQALTVTMESTPEPGTKIIFAPLNPSYVTNPLTIDVGTVPVNGNSVGTVVVNENGTDFEMIYVDSGIGWLLVNRGGTIVAMITDASGINNILTSDNDATVTANYTFNADVDLTAANVTGLPAATTTTVSAGSGVSVVNVGDDYEVSADSQLPADADGVLRNISGTLSWDSSSSSDWEYHTASFTAVSGGKYIVNGRDSITITMPSTPLANGETIEIVHNGYMEFGNAGPIITVPNLGSDMLRVYTAPTFSAFFATYSMKTGEHLIITNNTFPTGFTGNIFSISSGSQEFIGEKDTYIRVDTQNNRIELRPDETAGFSGYLLLDQSTGFNIAEFREGLAARFYDNSDSLGIVISGENLDIPQTGRLRLPDETNTDTGTGSLRYNRTSSELEVYDAGWNEVSASASASASTIAALSVETATSTYSIGNITVDIVDNGSNTIDPNYDGTIDYTSNTVTPPSWANWAKVTYSELGNNNNTSGDGLTLYVRKDSDYVAASTSLANGTGNFGVNVSSGWIPVTSVSSLIVSGQRAGSNDFTSSGLTGMNFISFEFKT